jgi:hypothetical protein
MACIGCRSGMGFRRAGMGRRHFMGATEDDATALVSTLAQLPAELTAEATIETGQVMYQTGFQTGQSKGLLLGALAGAALILIFHRS